MSTAAAIAAIATSIAAWPSARSCLHHEPLSRGRLGYRRHADRQRAASSARACRRQRRARRRPQRHRAGGFSRRPRARHLEGAQAALSAGRRSRRGSRGSRTIMSPTREARAIPGALEAMRELAARGVAQACVSNSGRTIVDANLEALGIGKIDRVLAEPRRCFRGQARSRALSRSRAPLRAAAAASSRSRTAAPAPVRRGRRDSYVVGYSPSGEPLSARTDQSRSSRKCGPVRGVKRAAIRRPSQCTPWVRPWTK